MSLVEFNNVYKRYKTGEIVINAVDGISFKVEEGEFAIVVGASGAGKTTVLISNFLSFYLLSIIRTSMSRTASGGGLKDSGP